MRLLKKLVGVLIVGLVGSATVASQTRSGSSPVLYEGARLIIGDASAPIEKGAFLVQDGRIGAIGQAGAVTAPAGARRVDLTGKTVMPTMVDVHTHLGYERYTNAAEGESDLPSYPKHYTIGNLLDHMQRYAFYGVGAANGGGGDVARIALKFQEYQAAGKFPPAAQLHFYIGMAPPGGGIDQWLIKGTDPNYALYHVTKVPEARSAVQDLDSRGIKGIKIWMGDRGGAWPAMPREVYEAIIDEAHKHGMKVQAHATDLRNQKDAVRAGVDVIVHAMGQPVDEEYLALVKEKKPYWTANNVAGRPWICEPDPFVEQAHTAKLVADARAAGAAGNNRMACGPVNAKSAEIIKANFVALVKAGMRVVLGTDAGAFVAANPSAAFGWTNHQYLASWVEWGLTPAEAIVNATSRPAELLGLKDVGTLASGKMADFIVLNANPLEDIRNTRTIASVYLRGVELDRAPLSAKWKRGDPVSEPTGLR